MMRLYHMAIATLVLLLSFSIVAWEMGDERDFKTLVEKSKKEQATCDSWMDEARKATGEKAVEILKRYPGTPPSTKALWKTVKENPRDEKLDFSILYQAGQCRLAAQQELVKRLIDASESVVEPERKEIARIALEVTARELDSPTTLVSVLTQLDVVKMVVAKKLVTMGLKETSKLQELGKLATEAVESLRHKTKPSAKDFYRELEFAERIRPPLTELVSSLR